MSITTSVPSVEFTPTGLVVPTDAAVLAGVQTDINAASGGNVNPTLTTPQGQVATSLSAIITDRDSTFAEFVDQVDPDNATGFMQDAIGRIYFINRNGATSTVVPQVCIGTAGTPITAGVAQVKDQSGNIYLCTTSGVIPIGGSITLPFANILTGPIAAPANTVNIILQGVDGWDTTNNPTTGVLGSEVESAADFEFRREQSVAVNAHGSLPAIYSNVFAVAGVIDCFATENVTDETITGPLGANESIPNPTAYAVLPHSVYVAVTGGDAAAIAKAIWLKKDLGCNMNGNTSVVVTDTSGYSYPFPSYNITFNIPTATAYNVIVNLANSSSLPSSIVADVTAAVTAQFNGVTGAQTGSGVTIQTSGARVRIGSLLLAAQFYGPVATCEGPGVPVSVLQILIGSTFAGLGTVVAESSTLTVTTATSGTLTPGTTVSLTGVPTGTTILRQLTGAAGGTGTYQMSAAATSTEASPEAVTGGGSTAQQIGIDQQPVLGTVTVNLVS